MTAANHHIVPSVARIAQRNRFAVPRCSGGLTKLRGCGPVAVAVLHIRITCTVACSQGYLRCIIDVEIKVQGTVSFGGHADSLF